MENIDDTSFVQWVTQNGKTIDLDVWKESVQSSMTADEAARKFITKKGQTLFDTYLQTVARTQPKPARIDIASLPETTYEISDTESQKSNDDNVSVHGLTEEQPNFTDSSDEIELLPKLTESEDVFVPAENATSTLPVENESSTTNLMSNAEEEKKEETPAVDVVEPTLAETKPDEQEEGQTSNHESIIAFVTVEDADKYMKESVIVIDTKPAVETSPALTFQPSKHGDIEYIERSEIVIVGTSPTTTTNPFMLDHNKIGTSLSNYADLQLAEQKTKQKVFQCFRNPANITIKPTPENLFIFGFAELFRQSIEFRKNMENVNSEFLGYVRQLVSLDLDYIDFSKYPDTVESFLSMFNWTALELESGKIVPKPPLMKLSIESETSISRAIESNDEQLVVLPRKIMVFDIMNENNSPIRVNPTLNNMQMEIPRHSMQFWMMQISFRISMIVTSEPKLFCFCMNQMFELSISENGKLQWKSSDFATRPTWNPKYVVYSQ